jgi:hypothetical protein
MLSRQDVYHLLLAQLRSLDLQITAYYSQWLVEVEIHEHGEPRRYTAVILAASFDYWRKRYHLAANPPSLVICYEHTSCLNVPVLSLHDGTLYAPCHFPTWFRDYGKDRVTHKGKQCLLGALLSGVGSAFDALDHLPRSTQYRYQNDLKMLRRRRKGRPVEGKKAS